MHRAWHLLISLALPATVHVHAQTIPRTDTELYEALSFVGSRLTKVKTEDAIWYPSDLDLLRRDRWSWTEISEDEGLILTKGVLEEYQVSPVDLVIPVEAKGKAIIVECRVEKCITVKRIRYIGVFSRNPEKLERTTENRPKNTWWFNSEDDARRVASAMTLALSRLGAKQRY